MCFKRVHYVVQRSFEPFKTRLAPTAGAGESVIWKMVLSPRQGWALFCGWGIVHPQNKAVRGIRWRCMPVPLDCNY